MKIPSQLPPAAAAKLAPASQFALSTFDNLPDSALVPIRVLTGLGLGSPSTVWRNVKNSRLPAPVKVSARRTAWQVGAIRQHLADLVAKGGAE